MVAPPFVALTSPPTTARSSFEEARPVRPSCACAPPSPPASTARVSQTCLRCTANLPTIVYWWRRLSRDFVGRESALRPGSTVRSRETDGGAGTRYRAPLPSKPERHHGIRLFRVRRHSGKPASDLRRVAQQRRARKNDRRETCANVPGAKRRVDCVERLYLRTQS